MINLTLVILLALTFKFIAYRSAYSAGECDRCPLQDLCAEASLNAEPSFCDDPRYKKYFDEHRETELLEILQKAADAEKNITTAETSINQKYYEVTIENGLTVRADTK